MTVSGRSDGSYSIEGALALTVFTICMMALLSILNVIKVEAEVHDAVHETAMELSQYSYVLGRTEYLKDAAEDHLEGLKKLLSSEEGEGEYSDLALTGPAVAKLLTRENFPREGVDAWLKDEGVVGGYEGLDFRDTQVLLDGKTIVIAVSYDLKINTYGLFDKVLHQRIAAATYGLLPTDSALKAMRARPEETSVWQDTNFVRGQYFAKKVREAAQYGTAVKPGQGIDLFDASTGTYTEVESINVFLPTYSSQQDAGSGSGGDTGPGNGAGSSFADPTSYAPRSDQIEKALFGYAKGLNKDISKLGKEVVLADESVVATVPAQKKILILIVPEETANRGAINDTLKRAAAEAQKKYGVTVELRYEQKALLEPKEAS
ncbi:MAG: hypothetical protein IKX83_05760 [Clostridia bacterium]|nr:hypothetical protein [Clostridia bacterium]